MRARMLSLRHRWFWIGASAVLVVTVVVGSLQNVFVNLPRREETQ